MRKFSLSFLFALMLFSMFAIAASAQGELYNPENGEITPGVVGDNIENANDTAEGIDVNDGSTAKTVKKNLTGHNVHTSYQNNTNSCASCHQTHTSQGDQLLFADTVYNTCTACHDGTLGYLNVFADGKNAKTTGAGTFGGTHGGSQHMANDSIKIGAAPGGNPVETSKTKGTMWGESFNCASCHAPHGSYSDRLLQYNPNGIGSMPASQGGLQLENVPVVDTLTGQTAPVVLLRTEDTTTGTVTVAQYNKGTSGYTKSTAPWLYGYDNRTNGLTYWSRLVKADGTIAAYGSTAGVYFSYDHAEAYSTTAAGAAALKTADKGFIARPVVVEMAKDGHNTIQSAYWSGADISKFEGKTAQELTDLGYKVSATNVVTNVGVQMSKFCAACHTDYLQANADGKKSHFGNETAAYRHSTNSDSYTCVRCHFGHGTDAYIMKDSLGRTINDLVTNNIMNETEALNYMQDNNASSALKKFTNMSVCWACHNSSHAETIKNAERRADHPSGMPAGN
ncbi:cytochrome c3 family protein [Neobacillus sp. CF12]|uniref:cytochrome c3 family protein n=1 Tax=Neobacillus sp. CF12 TaxID=3055864 RepID=UPI0025A16C88|nr:cytochrome c3 family protein [Neobacillus sp. CF12]MDM5330289.1 cytochrome c3 family protein [Neobacillus sp. CF12]